MYCHTQYYDPARESGIHFADPAVGIEWPLDNVIVSDKDQARELLPADFQGIELQ